MNYQHCVCEENQHFWFVYVYSVEDESTQYRLHVSGFSGTVEDSFSWYHDKQSFSTPDTGNICAEISHAGWWYNQCFYANLNGVYYKVWCGLLVIDTKVYGPEVLHHELLLLFLRKTLNPWFAYVYIYIYTY